MKKHIPVTVKKAPLMLALDEVDEFQGNLKELTNTSADKVRKSLVAYGYSFACHVWKGPDGRWKTIDGHQRNRVAKLMLSQGFKIGKDNKIPCIEIGAKDEKEAKQKILAAISQYGKVTEEGLYEFIQEIDLDMPKLQKHMDIPNIDLGKFVDGWAPDDGKKEPKAKIVECPKCGEKFEL